MSKLDIIAKLCIMTQWNGVAPKWQPPSVSHFIKRSIADISINH